ncbi:hypothetical protein BGW80DRAFT_224457 [Lactifluus volemus]|nr:hypothetical protein BGW80DRAFT_224457 [Lactifluus volemus]
MLPVLKILLDFLRRFRFPKSYPKRCSGDWAWLLAFIFRRLGLWRLWPRKTDTFPKSRPASPSFPRVEARGYSVLGSSTNVIAASTVPTSASLSSLREPSRLHMDTSNVHPHVVVVNPTTSPATPPEASSHTHEPLSPPADHRSHRRQSLGSGSVAVDISPPPPLTLAIDSATARSSSTISVGAQVLEEESPQLSPIASSLTSDFSMPEGRYIALIHSDQVPRYSKGIKISRDEMTSYQIKPLTTVFPYTQEQCGSEQGTSIKDCSPWRPATHPDGALYFYDRERRIFTDTDMLDSLLRDEIEEFYRCLQNILLVDKLKIPSNNYDLVLDIIPIGDTIQWSYYYACHETRCLFWLETYDAAYVLPELCGVKSLAHIKHRLEASYWNHWSLYPAVFKGRSLPLPVYDELTGILSHGCVDVLTSKSSTLPFDDDTMLKMIGLLKKAREADGGVEYFTAATTRLLSFFAHWRFLYFHGQKHARLVKGESVYAEPKYERTMLITLVSPMLFFAPEIHLRDVERLWTDEIVIETVWRSFMAKLLKEWKDIILWSTVMLTANVGFLAIPGVVITNLSGAAITDPSQLIISTSPAQVASSVSIQASVGSILVGLLLLSHNRMKQKLDRTGAVSDHSHFTYIPK